MLREIDLQTGQPVYGIMARTVLAEPALTIPYEEARIILSSQMGLAIDEGTRPMRAAICDGVVPRMSRRPKRAT